MNIDECIKSLVTLLYCVDDHVQGERDKLTKLVDIKPSSFEYVIESVINILEEVKNG